MADRAFVRNAADRTQVKYAGKKEQDRDALLRAATEQVMHHPGGRMFVWSLLQRFGAFESVVDERPGMIFYRAGRQDAAHELQALVIAAGEDDYDLMAREARMRDARLARETDAVHTKPAEDAVT